MATIKKLQTRRGPWASIQQLLKGEIASVLDRRKLVWSHDGAANRVINDVTPWEAGILAIVGDLFIKDGLIFQVGIEHTTAVWASETANWNLVSKPGNVVVADITARDAITGLDLFEGLAAYVVDASDDGTVDSGAALYVYGSAAWNKIAEFESLDITINDATESIKGVIEIADAAV